MAERIAFTATDMPDQYVASTVLGQAVITHIYDKKAGTWDWEIETGFGRSEVFYYGNATLDSAIARVQQMVDARDEDCLHQDPDAPTTGTASHGRAYARGPWIQPGLIGVDHA